MATAYDYTAADIYDAMNCVEDAKRSLDRDETRQARIQMDSALVHLKNILREVRLEAGLQ